MKSHYAILLGVLTLFGCRQPEIAPGECSDRLGSDAFASCTMGAYPTRSYDVYVPDGDGPFPVVFTIHGGGGNRAGATRTTCPEGEESSPRCLHNMAIERGYVYVAPDGTSSKLADRSRSWNGGGGSGDWRCTGGRACDENVDELAYFEALLQDLSRRVDIDRKRLYVTGLSNGGTMSHRLACQLEGVKAVFAINGTLQWTTGESCNPPAPVAVAHAHGTEDPCWPYETGATQCPIGKKDKKMKGVDDTMSEWATILACTGERGEATRLPNTADDGTTTDVFDWPGCSANLRHYRINGAGHTWPNGHQYLGEGTVGIVPRDWGNEVILDWFDAN